MDSRASSPASPAERRLTAALLLLQFSLMWTAVLVLGAAIDWPASLGDPAAVALPRLAGHRVAVAVGYTCYLASALLLVPVSALLARTLRAGRVAGALVVALGTLAAFAKALGIARWLLVMPGLADAYVGGDRAVRATVAVVYGAFNAYLGGVGEGLGVSLLGGLWTATVAILLRRRAGRMERALGAAGLGAAALLLALLPGTVGADMGVLLVASGVAWQVWLAGLGVWHLTRTSEGTAEDAAPATRRQAATAVVAGLCVLALAPGAAQAQTPPPTFGEVGIGRGRGTFGGVLRTERDARRAGPANAGLLSFAFYRRVGGPVYVGGRFRVHIALPAEADGGDSEVFFNHYSGGVTARLYARPAARAGAYVQADAGYGQFTQKYRSPDGLRADHQFAVGPNVLGAVGYAVRLGGHRRLGLQVEAQRHVTNGDVDGAGEQAFRSGSVGAQLVLGF